ncbi:ABC transporter ATP-binding protein [Janibacter limosus]|jgi:iron(III) transport system ATP-binding protein|uniref:ABC-type quaternary amine transporter n=1 Tax=Janibacter limosus TaxID=53458 RepID=A0A4P6MXX9_9MICO|nr:ABC transporter ATP-binding protein [Janibacter limosus]QBF46815.1 ABC transporter ATP-binding protein [Janibacter limosus]
MSTVDVRGITVGYGAEPVLREIDLTVHTGTTTAVLGASGGGKTTLLRVIAGFLQPDAGTVVIGERTVCGDGRAVPPERRGIGYVRQDGGLFPHLDVGGNIAFGLPRAARRRRDRVAELLELVGLPAQTATRRPAQLSGGQQQRVALARALALSPAVVLLDEPFSSLDTALRASTREAVAAALAETAATTILVTHDQQEALSFADQVAIMRDGRFSQVGSPREIYESPVDLREASFLGDVVHLTGHCVDDGITCPLGLVTARSDSPAALSGEVDVVVRPEDLTLTDSPGCPHGSVQEISYHGAHALVRVALDDGTAVTVRVVGRRTPEPGEQVPVSVIGPVLAYPRA